MSVRMPRRAAKLVSALVKASTPRRIKGKKRALVRHMAQGTLLAVTIAAARLDIEEPSQKRRLFDSGLLDRLSMPLTRYHE
jgi:hypothetical protein